MTGAEARWLKRYMLRHGPGYNPNTSEPTAAEAEGGDDKSKPADAKQGEKPKK